MSDKSKQPEPPIEAAAGLLALEIVTMLLARFTSTGLVDRESIRAALDSLAVSYIDRAAAPGTPPAVQALYLAVSQQASHLDQSLKAPHSP